MIMLLTHDDAFFQQAETISQQDETRYAHIERQIRHDTTHKCQIAIEVGNGSIDGAQQATDLFQMKHSICYIAQLRPIHCQGQQGMRWTHVQ